MGDFDSSMTSWLWDEICFEQEVNGSEEALEVVVADSLQTAKSMCEVISKPLRSWDFDELERLARELMESAEYVSNGIEHLSELLEPKSTFANVAPSTEIPSSRNSNSNENPYPYGRLDEEFIPPL